jgi:hypothetical protein
MISISFLGLLFMQETTKIPETTKSGKVIFADFLRVIVLNILIG